MKSKNKRKRSLEELIAECEHEYATWENIHQNGCRDPCHADGVNLNLVRNLSSMPKKRLKSTVSRKAWKPHPFS